MSICGFSAEAFMLRVRVCPARVAGLPSGQSQPNQKKQILFLSLLFIKKNVNQQVSPGLQTHPVRTLLGCAAPSLLLEVPSARNAPTLLFVLCQGLCGTPKPHHTPPTQCTRLSLRGRPDALHPAHRGNKCQPPSLP